MIRPPVLGDDRADRRVRIPFWVDPGGGFEVPGLEDLVRLVVAVGGVDRAEDGELIEHGRLLR